MNAQSCLTLRNAACRDVRRGVARHSCMQQVQMAWLVRATDASLGCSSSFQPQGQNLQGDLSHHPLQCLCRLSRSCELLLAASLPQLGGALQLAPAEVPGAGNSGHRPR